MLTLKSLGSMRASRDAIGRYSQCKVIKFEDGTRRPVVSAVTPQLIQLKATVDFNLLNDLRSIAPAPETKQAFYGAVSL